MKLRDPKLQRRARRIRHEATPFEVILWRHLSNSQLGGYKFRRQAIVENYIVDFYCPQYMLAVEIDGDTHEPAKDAQRDTALAALGIQTLRFTNREVAGELEGVLQAILTAVQGRRARFREPAAA